MPRIASFLPFCLLWTCAAAVAQPKFEAASVKVSTQRFLITEGGPGTKSPNRIRYEGVSLRQLLMSALDIHAAQLVGPTGSEHYSVNAVLPPNSTKQDLQAMLLDLVRERFQVVLRQQNKEFRVYELVVAEQGHKLRESGAPTEDSGQPKVPELHSPGLKLDSRGCPVLPAGEEAAAGNSASTCMSYRQMTMEQFVPKLEMMLGAETGAIFGPTASGDPVIDKNWFERTFRL